MLITIIHILIKCNALSLHAYSGQVEANYTTLELKVHLQPTMTCSEFLVSCLGILLIRHAYCN